jgi:glycosyltransferase involved in cell wall biosynthesis
MNKFPLVSIIAVCYNQEKWVAQTLDSIAMQTYPNIELIIADDGSADGSKDVIKKWIKNNNVKVRFIDHEKNIGLTKNINSAVPFVNGKYYQAFGCDDIMLPQKIETQVKILETQPHFGIIYTDMFLINSDGEMLEGSYFERDFYKQPVSGNIYKDLIERIIISSPSVLIRKEILDTLSGYTENLHSEDYDFFMRASRKYQFLYLPEKTVKYRVSEKSMSVTVKKDEHYQNTFLIFYQNYQPNDEFAELYNHRFLFFTKNLYSLKFRHAANYFFKAFLKTKKIIFLKYCIASIPFYFRKEKAKQ